MLSIRKLLNDEVRPALGCTEPGAVALAVSRACEELTDRDRIESVHVTVSSGIYKNGIAVGVPGVRGAWGNAVAAALATFCGRSSHGLESLRDCASCDVARAVAWANEGHVRVEHTTDHGGIYVNATVVTPDESATCIVEHTHTNITQVTKNDRLIFSRDPAEIRRGRPPESDWAQSITFRALFTAAQQCPQADLDYVMEGVAMNRAIADYGLADTSLLDFGYGAMLRTLLEDKDPCSDLGYRIRYHCYAAVEARMAGARLPVMSSAGSGNGGIAAILPVALAGEAWGADRESIGRAVLLSHLTTSYVKHKVGSLTSLCGCAVASGAGAAAAIAMLRGCGPNPAARAIRIVLANTAGMFCDGAKESCALKVGTAAHEAYLAALFALHGSGDKRAQGIADTNVDKTVDNIARISRKGMRYVDQVMISIMDERTPGDLQDDAGEAFP